MSVKYVEYLEADGNSYFELPAGTITWDNNSGIEVQYYHNAYTNNSFLIGAYGQNGNTSISTYYEQLRILMFEQNFTKHWDTNEYTADIQPYAHTIKIDKNGRTFDGVTESITWSEPESWIFERINVSPVRIFGQGSNQGDNYKYVALQGTRIYYVKIYNGDEVVHYFRPCLKGNTPCIYDEISQTFYYNQGTGTFGYGKALNTLHLFANNNQGTAENLGSYRLYNMKIEGDSEGVESGVNYVDCLIGDGNSYIDTGIIPTNGYTIDIEFMVYKRTDGNGEALYGNGYQWNISYSDGVALEDYYHSSYGQYLKWIDDRKATDVNRSDGNIIYDKGSHADKRLTYSHTIKNITSTYTLGLFATHSLYNTTHYYKGAFTGRIYDFKIYNVEGTLIQHLRPCLDTEGVPCMYDEVSKQYFLNQGTGTFGYKKELRDFQPVLDSNGVPCLMDKINKKYYYDKNGNLFDYAEQSEYKRVGYLKGDGNSYIDTGLIPNEMHGYKIEIKYVNATDMTNESVAYQQMLFGSSEGGLDKADTNCHIRYDWQAKPQGLTFDSSIDYSAKNGTVIETNATINTPTSSYSIYLFGTNGVNTNSDNHNACDATIYYWKVYDTNNNLIQHLIPAIDTDGSIGMYDLVTETFFYNQGTGEFSYGIEELENVLLSPYKNIEISKHIQELYGKDNSGVNYIELLPSGDFYMYTRKLDNYEIWQNRAKSGEKKPLKLKPNTAYTIYTVTEDTSRQYSSIHARWIFDALGNELFGYTFTKPYEKAHTFTTGNCGDVYLAIIYSSTMAGSNGIKPFYVYLVEGDYAEEINTNGIDYYDIATPIKYIETNGTQYIDTGVVPTDNTDIDMVARAIAKEYTPVEYLQGDGNSYIDTGLTVTGTANYDMEIKYEMVDNGKTNVVWGSCDPNNVANNSKRFGLMYQSGLGTRSGGFENITNINPSTGSVNTIGTATFINNIFNDTNTPNINGIGLFAVVDGRCASIHKISHFKVWDAQDNLVQHLIAVLDNEGTPCMYDLVTKTFFYNKGTGTFSYGDITPSKNYLMNDFYTDTTYKYKEIDTTVEPNLTASEGATLTLGSTYMSYLTESEIEQATKNGWIIE